MNACIYSNRKKSDIEQYLSANELNPALFNVSQAKNSFNWAYFFVRHLVGHEQKLDDHHLILRDDFNITVVPDIRKCSFIDIIYCITDYYVISK